MYKKNTYSWLKHWDFTLIDILCMEAAFWLAVIIRNGFTDKLRFPVYRHSSLALVFLNICIVFFIQSYKGVLRRSIADEVRRVIIHVTCVLLLMVVYMYMSQEAYFYSRFAFVLFWVFYVVLTLLGRLALKKRLCTHRRETPGTRSLLLIVSDEKGEHLVEQVSRACYGNIRVSGVALIEPCGAGEDGGKKVEGGESGDKEHDPGEKEPETAGNKSGTAETGGRMCQDAKKMLAGIPVVACGEEILNYIK
ncbi:MAG: hypothetical protein LUC83_03315, partial [Clostridiales bacterium]|nr:hypothetical protein [Clostridiales bacterium]